MKKRKINGYLKLLLVLLFSMVLSTFSTCYARTRLTEDEAKYIYNYLISNEYQNEINNGTIFNTYYNNSLQFSRTSSTQYLDFYNYFNSNNTLDFSSISEMIFWARFYNSGFFDIIYTNVNMGKVDSLPHIYFEFSNNTQNQNLRINFIDDNKNPVTHKYYAMTYDNGSFYRTEEYNYISTQCYIRLNNWNDGNQGKSYIENLPGFVTFYSTNAIYTNFDGVNSFSSPTTKLLLSLYDNGNTGEDIPVNPPIDTGNTGEITNTNGDKTGQIDLSGIQNGIGNINQSINNQGQAIVNNQNENTDKIIQNQNQNTQATVNAINNANENYWGGEEDLNEEQHNQEIEGNVNDLMENVSGELAKNEVIKMLDEAEKGFIAKFQKGLAEEAYDLKFEWDDIKFKLPGFVDEEITIIPKYKLNISEICRQNETMEVVKGYIQVIATFTVVMNILGTIYNMILHALGVSHPELTVKFDEPVQNDKMLGPGPDDNGTIHL